MRLYEATGTGALLVTDSKPNLGDIFDIGREVVDYRTEDECIERVLYYLGHEGERSKIASAGQQRTLREHTYFNRMCEMVDIVRTYISVKIVGSPKPRCFEAWLGGTSTRQIENPACKLIHPILCLSIDPTSPKSHL